MKETFSTLLNMIMIALFLLTACGAPATPPPAPTSTVTPSPIPPTFTPQPTSTSTPLPSTTSTNIPTNIIAFSTDFNSGVPPQFSDIVTTESVQGYSGIGTGNNVFSGDFLRNSSIPPLPTTLTLTGLPAHTSIDLHFLLAIIDSWDGTGSACCGIDSFTITIDGEPVFNEVFNNAAIGGVQSYIPPPGVELARTVELGFRDIDEHDQDSGYDMGKNPTFSKIPHTSNILTIEWFASGPGWQGDFDESWAIDNLEFVLNMENE